MIQAWRIVHEDYLSTAFDGEGARIAGGRWNSEGTRVVYTAGTLSLALLEMIVHLEIKKALHYFKAIPISFAKEMAGQCDTKTLPPTWSGLPVGFATKALGDDWARQQSTAVLSVPSAVVPNEINYLLNPLHPDFSSIVIQEPIQLPIDPRFVEKLK